MTATTQPPTPKRPDSRLPDHGAADAAATGVGPPPAGARVPDFFIVGHAKCGTTALHQMLRQHPQIFMPELKEPRFLATDLITPTDGRTLAQARAGTPLPTTLEEYLDLFADARPGQRAGEASPLYMISSAAAGAIAQLQPNARIIAILREPASFLRSVHLQLLQNRNETVTDFRRAVELEPARREGRELPRGNVRRPQRLMYSERVRYVDQLRRFHDVFPREQVLVLIYEDFRRDNEGTVREVLRFLEVDDSVAIEPIEANPTVLVRPQVEARLKGAIRTRGPISRGVRAAVERVAPEGLRRHARRAVTRSVVEGRPPPVDEQFMAELRRRFKPEVVALGEYLGRDLVTLWKYDGIH
jgi:hypothetical protein